MQLQGATIVSLPPAGTGTDLGMGHPFPDGGMYGDDSGDDRAYNPHGDRPRTTGMGALSALRYIAYVYIFRIFYLHAPYIASPYSIRSLC